MRFAIVGAGMLGLTLAWRRARAAHGGAAPANRGHFAAGWNPLSILPKTIVT
jgi:glycine/D-amino acid oxidase-like deaminating enzyme